jgi:hypothetical protein
MDSTYAPGISAYLARGISAASRRPCAGGMTLLSGDHSTSTSPWNRRSASVSAMSAALSSLPRQ